MTQGGLIAGALLLAWIMYLAINNRFAAYLAVFTGTGTAAAATPATSSATPAAPGSTVGSDPAFAPSLFRYKPGSIGETLFGTPLNPPT